MGDNENTLSVAEMELETLHSIYVNELEVKKEEDASTSISICLHPATADNVEEQYVRIVLKFILPEQYPDSVPEISIRNARGLSDEQIDRIHQLLSSLAEDRKGSSMLFELIEAAKEKLTEENRPSENCVICLYGFSDEDVITKTECYHYFHSHCLNTYIESKLEEAAESENADATDPSTLCPLCRLPITFTYKAEGFPEPVAVTAACIELEPAGEQQEKMERLYQKQLAQGGIIDVEAEKNKYLLTTSTVVPDRPRDPDASTRSEEPVAQCEEPVATKSDDGTTQNRRRGQHDSNRFNHRGRGGYRNPNRRNYDWNNDFQRGRGRFNANYRHQNNRQVHKNEHSDREQSCEPTESHGSQNSPGNSMNESRFYNGHQRYNDRRGSRGNFRRPWNQSNAPRNYHNRPPHHSYRTDNNRGSKFPNSRDRPQPVQTSNDNHEESNSVSANSCVKSNSPEENESNSIVDQQKEIPKTERNYDRNYSGRGQRYNYRNPGRSYNDRNQRERYGRKWDNVNGESNADQKDESPEQNESVRGEGSDNSHKYRNHNYHSQRYVNRQKHQAPNFEGPNRGEMHMDKEHGEQAQDFNQSSYRERKISNDAQGTHARYKSSSENNVPKKGNKSNDAFSSQSEHIESRPSNSSSDMNSKASANPVKSSHDSHAIPDDKDGPGICRPPPGFANPLKKVVYGLPSVNPPPGFSHS